LEAARGRAFAPLGRRGGDIQSMRRALLDTMWNDVGILRDAAGLERARGRLDALAQEIATSGAPDPEPRYNLTWMDLLNLGNLVLTSRAICATATARHDSRGAHFREDFPQASELAASRYTVARLAQDRMVVNTAPVSFTRVRPGET